MPIEINGKNYLFKKGETILDVAKRNEIDIPTLCFHPMLKPEGRCRVCLVESNGKIVTSCDTLAVNKMNVVTDSEKAKRFRRESVDLLASSVPPEALREENELTQLMKKIGLKKTSYPHHVVEEFDRSSQAICKRTDRCIVCGRCVQVCSDKQTVDAIAFAFRGEETIIDGVNGLPIDETNCVSCGQCTLVCPTNAIKEVLRIDDVERGLRTKKHKVVQIAPSVRVSLGECFGLKPGKIVTGQVVAALKKAGFDAVFDTNFSADLTIVEEATEFVEKAVAGKTPLFTSCCPAWIDFCCEFYPEFVGNISSCKSPQQMLGALIKPYYAKKAGVKAENIFSVSIMPCTAKKKEAGLKQMKGDVDFVLTTRELAELLKRKHINLSKLKPKDFDSPLGESTGAGTLFGVTGGVMEAALRTAYFKLEGRELKDVELKMVRGNSGVRECEIKIKGKKFRAAVAHGLGNARKLLERMKEGEKIDFVEVMACPGGCIGGGGQPKPINMETIKARMQAIYSIDKKKTVRRSHLNKEVQKLYSEFLGSPGSKKAKKLLHRSYPKKGKTR